MAETCEENDKIWIKFLRNHWQMTVACAVGCILAIIGAIWVFLWFVDVAQSTGLVPVTLNLWAMGHLVTFLIHLVLRLALIIGIPAFVVGVLGWQLWWKKIPEDERLEYKRKRLFGKSSKRSDGGNGISFLIFVFFAIKIYLDGNWDKPFASWEFDYLVYSWLWAIIWIAVIFGIPILIGGIAWIRHEMKKAS
jgi:hypothetical protein